MKFAEIGHGKVSTRMDKKTKESKVVEVDCNNCIFYKDQCDGEAFKQDCREFVSNNGKMSIKEEKL